MKKVLFVLSVAVMSLIVFGIAYGEEKTAGPGKTNVLRQVAPGVVKPMIVDIAIDVFTDAKTCRLWVAYQNKGTVKIDKVLREKVIVNGTVVPGGDFNHVVLNPGAFFSHGVGVDPGVIISGSATVNASIDTENVLKENNEANNSITKTVACQIQR